MKIFGYILIAFTLLLTVIVGIKQPKMHTKLFIYDSNYEIVDEKHTPSVDTIKKTEEMPSVSVDNNQSRIQIAMEEMEQPVEKVEVKTIKQPKTTQQTQQNKTVTQTTPTKTIKKQTSQKTTETKPVEKTTVQNKPKTTQTNSQIANVNTQTKTNTQPTQTQIVKKTVPSQPTVKVLTVQEEEIAWNVWRSNLQNKIMKDSKLPAIPIGTVFKVSFDVDKYGKITNLQTWSTNSKYTPYAIEFIAPVIKSYQGKAILEFPKGSQRTKTTFTGGWKIATTAKYSNPNDYNDTERIIK